MKKLFTCAIALGMAASMPALADDHHEQGGGHGGGAPGGGHGPAMAEHAPAMGGGHPMAMSHAAPMAQEHHQTFSHAAAPAQHEMAAPHAMAETHHYSGAAQHNVTHAAPAYTHGGGHSGALSAPHHDVRATHHFHNGSYNPPAGYHPQHWRHGEHLPDAYYGRNYWIDDYVDFGLYAPPPDYVWVRVGDDAVLIDQDDGEIVQVEYGIFY